jgi:hypothetical protein
MAGTIMKSEIERRRYRRHATKALVCLPAMMTRAVMVALVLRVALGVAFADAITLPVVAPGDAFSGSLTLDPSTPLSSGSRPPHLFEWSNPGNISVTLGGQTFAASIGLVARSDSTLPQWQISAGGTSTNEGTVNGEAVPYLVISLELVDNSGSTSIFPTDFAPAPTPISCPPLRSGNSRFALLYRSCYAGVRS